MAIKGTSDTDSAPHNGHPEMTPLEDLLFACHVQGANRFRMAEPARHFSLLAVRTAEDDAEDGAEHYATEYAVDQDAFDGPPFVADEARDTFIEEHLKLVTIYDEPDAEVRANFFRYLFRGHLRSDEPDEPDNAWRVACRLVPTTGAARLPILSPERAPGADWQSVAVPDGGHLCTFSLFTAGFSARDQAAFARAFRLCENPGSFLSPYLAVHYGAEDNAMRAGAILTGSAALRARVVVRQDADQRRRDAHAPLRKRRGLRHYSITLSRDRFTVLCLAPITETNPDTWNAKPAMPPFTAATAGSAGGGSPPLPVQPDMRLADSRALWRGCYVDEVGTGSCKQKTHLKLLVDWVNAIHAWGTGEHTDELWEDMEEFRV